MANELQLALSMLENDKGIPKEYVIDALITALTHAYKKNYKDDAENVEVSLDNKTGNINVFAKKTVVEESDYDESEATVKILLSEAKKIKKNSKVGDILDISIMPKDFGRIAAQTGKQIILQKLREAERQQILAEFKIKSNDIISGSVQRIEKIDFKNNYSGDNKASNEPRFNIIFDIGKAEAVMPPKEQVLSEKYKFHDRLKLYVMDVKNTPKGPYIMVSRSAADFVKKLFKKEVPEIESGIVEIKAVSREPGVRSKIAVYSNDEQVDPVGSCVGNRGSRVNAVVDEIKGEKVDIIKYSDDPAEFIKAALSPAKVIDVHIDEASIATKKRSAVVIVSESQLSLAIGKEGLNAKLAAKLTGWKIDIKSDIQYAIELENATDGDFIINETEDKPVMNDINSIEELIEIYNGEEEEE